MKDLFQEIFIAMRTNKLRTTLTGFAIAWGIFMLIILLGAGNGLQNAVFSNFSARSKNSITVWGSRTTMPYEGLQIGREIKFTQSDLDYFKNNIPQITDFSPLYRKNSVQLFYGTETTTSTLSAVESNYSSLRKFKMLQGRFLNKTDDYEKRKVLVLHFTTADILFHDKNPIGEYVRIDEIPFQVVGVYKEDGASRDLPFYMPLSTSQLIFNPSGFIDQFSFNVKDVKTFEESVAYNELIYNILAYRMQFSPDDTGAVWVRDTQRESEQANMIFGWISTFVWVVGIFTLMSGLVGVSNIMIISIKERTREFGIRKALGATPGSVLRLVILEAIAITTIFGYIGMALGIFLMEGIGYVVETMNTQSAQEYVMFKDPTVDMGVAIAATVILILAGVLAGYIPARRAVRIRPIEAMMAK